MSKTSHDQTVNRRQVLQTLAAALPLTMLASAVLAQTPAAAPAAAPVLKPLPDNDPTAKALKYSPDATTAARTDKMGVAAKDQNCKVCQFYTKAGELQGKEVGKCLMLPAGVVSASGWCMSWTKKA